jgi:spore coat protein A, manganese oxidase
MYYVSDDLENSLPLPKGYHNPATGQGYDVPLVLQDKIFTPNGQFLYDNRGNKGVNGDVILVNGVPWPRMEVANRKYRFRLLNGSAARSYRLSLSTGEPFIMIGTDAGLIEKPIEVKNFRIGMAERYEFIIDFSKYRVGTQIILRNANPKNNEPFDNTNVVMRFDVVREEPDNSQVPSFMRAYNRIPVSYAKRTREWRFERNNDEWQINGRTWDPNRVDANPGLGDVEIWRLYNKAGGWFHPVHIHLIDFQILSRNGKPPFPYEVGWKDVVYVGENEDVRVIGKFGPHLGRYMMHCHNLDHEDFDMMIQWEVGQGGPSPMSAPPKPLPAPPL